MSRVPIPTGTGRALSGAPPRHGRSTCGIHRFDALLHRAPELGDLGRAERAGIILAGAHAMGQRPREADALADLAGPDRNLALLEPGARMHDRRRFLLAALGRTGVEHHRVRLVALARAFDGL